MTAQPSTVNVQDNAPLGDWELVTAAQASDRDAFGELYSRHAGTVWRYIIWRMEDRHLAEQLTSEVFLRALRRIDTVSDVGKDFPAWLIVIARNAVYDYTKSARWRLDRPVGDIPEQRAHEDPEAQTVHSLTTEFLTRQLSPCLRKLTREQQEVIGLRFWTGLSVTDTATVMGKDTGAVKALQHRAVRRLALLLPDDAASWLHEDAGVAS